MNREESLRRLAATTRLAQTPEDFARMMESTVMRRAIYPKYIFKGLLPICPEGCLEPQEEKDLYVRD